MNDNFSSIVGVSGTVLLNLTSGAEIRGEVSAWVTLIGSIAITLTTIGSQVYDLIRDRNEDKKKNQPAEEENKDKEYDEKNG